MIAFRSLPLLLAIAAFFHGFSDLYLRVTNSFPSALEPARSTVELGSGPTWVEVQGRIPPVEPAILAGDSGEGRGAWLPLLALDDEQKVIAILQTPSVDDLLELSRLQGPVSVEGLARAAGSRERKLAARSWSRLGLRSSPELALLLVGAQPSGYATAAILLALGAGLLALSLWNAPWAALSGACARGLRALRTRAEPSSVDETAAVHTIRPYDASGEEEIARTEVFFMLDEVWNGVVKDRVK